MHVIDPPLSSLIAQIHEKFHSPLSIEPEALNAGQPKDVTADRVDMTREIMDKHYDKATKNEQIERREDYLVDI